MFCSAKETIGPDRCKKRSDRSFARSAEVAVAPEVVSERLVPPSLFSPDEAAMGRNERFDSLVESSIEFIPEFLAFAPADALRIQGVVRHVVVKHENIAGKR